MSAYLANNDPLQHEKVKKVPVGPTWVRYEAKVYIEEVNVVTKRGA